MAKYNIGGNSVTDKEILVVVKDGNMQVCGPYCRKVSDNYYTVGDGYRFFYSPTGFVAKKNNVTMVDHPNFEGTFRVDSNGQEIITMESSNGGCIGYGATRR